MASGLMMCFFTKEAQSWIQWCEQDRDHFEGIWPTSKGTQRND